jgi:hypothetical protein
MVPFTAPDLGQYRWPGHERDTFANNPLAHRAVHSGFNEPAVVCHIVCSESAN